MCGIVAAAAGSNIVPVLVEGLKRLEYRGYDSAGIAVIGAGNIERVRSVGRVAELEHASASTQSVTGIAHTRWATHGVPTERNAHPHVSGSIAVVHNGIIENYESLRADLSTRGYVFTSDTDTESIAHLIQAGLEAEPDLFKAVQIACRQLVGAYAIAVIDHTQPGKIIVAREGSPLLLGVSDTGNYAASDASALLQVTRNMVYLENGDIAELTATAVRIARLDGTPVERPVHVSELSAAAVELGPYQHYMQKEIFEQPEALANTLEIVGGSKSIQPGIFGAAANNLLSDVDAILILACGTSSHSGYTARYWLEAIAGVPCTVEIASEYRYRSSVPNPRQLIVAISQSGETADTLAALRHAKRLGQQKTLAICNVPESAIVRESELRFITRAGPEIGVASTKAFTTQLAALFVLTLVMAKVRNRLTSDQENAYIDQLRHLPVAVNKVLELESDIKVWAQRFADKQHALFLGRGRHYPIAMEGALKLKEIS
ncbi:MAG: glutamine--fructose-6-phosphate transaminase (isomerizing), partial [Azonexus sp.]